MAQIKYRHESQKVEITAQQAGQVAQWAIGAGAWDGTAANMVMVHVERDSNSSTGFSAIVHGFKTVDAADVPVGVKVEEVVP
jgi:hypothetical protein